MGQTCYSVSTACRQSNHQLVETILGWKSFIGEAYQLISQEGTKRRYCMHIRLEFWLRINLVDIFVYNGLYNVHVLITDSYVSSLEVH